ncbi:MAG: hypothetical protein JO223_03720 [Hyphomicrobiales bacterium]|nr:hypothetical protein [Hyphomicrobiales bacterium]MBV8439931.1 hypothetical protein [Hyphomicrobiales bacterium]
MKAQDWMTALAAGAFCALIGGGGTLAQTVAPAAEAPAQAAPAAKKAKAKPKDQPEPTVEVTVVNSRAAGLVELQATESGFPTWKKIAGPLKAGQKAAARVPRGKDCKVDLHGTFADGQSMDAEGVDVCASKMLNLKD